LFIPKNFTDVNPVPVDTMAPLSWFSNCGYFVVDKEIFLHKIYALQAATRKRLAPEDITWIFNNDAYNSINWTAPKNVSLASLYRARAQQLREKYSYLVLSFSGGGDSTNVLDSFILNNIHLDEVLVGWPRSQTAGKYTPNLSSSNTNFVSEWDYLIQPKLKWLETVSPKTKITIVDPYENLVAKEPEKDIVEITPRHNYIGVMRYKAIDDVLLERQETYKNVAIIMGINPPNLLVSQKRLYTYFNDVVTSMWPSDYTYKGLNRQVEYFYWTPDMPEIPCVQAHALLAALKTNKDMQKYLSAPEFDHKAANVTGHTFNKIKNLYSEILRRYIKSVLYPTYDYNNLQVDKNSSAAATPEWFSWFYDNPHSKEILQPHDNIIAEHQSLIDPRFFIMNKGQVAEYYIFRSKLYYVGELT